MNELSIAFGEALRVMDALVVAYVAAFFLINLAFVGLSYSHIRQELQGELARPARGTLGNTFLPSISLLVPAYNEEVTIVESIRSLLHLQYPSFEVVICNDGSSDRTLDVLRREFHFVPIEREYNDHLQTAAIRTFYEARIPLPAGLKRLVLIDKANGGKADALNAAINVAQGEFVTSMDADSLLVPDALLRAAQPIADDPSGVVAVGAQVGLANGSRIEGGRVVEMGLPPRWIARFQVVEYMRSFAQGRVAFASLDALLVLSGVFALLRRDLVLAIGGFLTPHMRSRVGREYCGDAAHTVCEDMEIVVRLHRYMLDHRLKGRVLLQPFPSAWTEAPEQYVNLGKQRARWYRGLLEVLSLHSAVLFRPRYRQVGLFSLPYQLVFEALAPALELCGYVLFALGALLGVLSLPSTLAFLTLAAAINLFLSSLAVLVCVYAERGARRGDHALALFPYRRSSDIALLLLFGLISNFGYRQFLLVWQLRGLLDFLRRRKGWDKFARQGFAGAT